MAWYSGWNILGWLNLILLFCSYCAGDVTDQGFSKKKAKIEARYPQPTHDQKASEMAGRLACRPPTSVQASIRALYGRRPAFHPSAHNPCEGKKKGKTQGSQKESQKILKRLTVVCLPPTVYAVPKRKMRDTLVEGGKVKEIVLSPGEDDSQVTSKVLKLFPQLSQFRYMHASSSGDIICAELPEGHSGWDGDAVCSIADGSNVYIKPASSQVSGRKEAPSPSRPTPPILALGQVPLKAIGHPITHPPTVPHYVPCPSVAHPYVSRSSVPCSSLSRPSVPLLSSAPLPSAIPQSGSLPSKSIQQSPQIGSQYVVGPRVFAVVVGSNQPAGKPGKVIVVFCIWCSSCHSGFHGLQADAIGEQQLKRTQSGSSSSAQSTVRHWITHIGERMARRP